MKTTFKIVLSLLLALVMLFSLVSCFSGGEGSKTADAVEGSKEDPKDVVKDPETTTKAPDTVIDPPHEHTWGDYTVVEEPNCGKAGKSERKCSGCDEVEEQILSKVGEHDFDADNKCKVCSSEYVENGLIFTYQGDKGYLVTDYTGDGGIVEIPSTYKGSPVTAIASEAFYSKKNVTGVVIPASITTIGADAFRASLSIKSVYITDLAKWCGIDFYNLYSNPLCFLGDLYVNGVKTTELVIPDGVEEISEFAFYHGVGIESVVISADVEKIADNSFMFCTGVKKISVSEDNKTFKAIGNCLVDTTTKTLVFGCSESVIPDDGSVETIGSLAFYACEIKKVDIPSSVKLIDESAFARCEKLESLTLAEGVETIEELAFTECTSLKKVVLPRSIKKISSSFEFGTSGVKELHISDLAAWCTMEFDWCIMSDSDFDVYVEGKKADDLVIPDGVEYISSYAFYGWDDIKSITVPDSVKRIHEYAFGCTNNLTELKITGDGLVIEKDCFSYRPLLEKVELIGKISVGEYAFRECEKLKTLVIGDGVESIGRNAFDGCVSLEEVYIPESVKELGDQAFFGCVNVKKVTLSANGGFSDFVNMFSSSFELYVIGDEVADKAFWSCDDITKVTIADSVKTIGTLAFAGCYGIEEIDFGSGVEVIGENAFAGCAFESIELPKSLKKIGKAAFSYCSSLESVVIPSGVTEVGANAFERCEVLSEVIFDDCAVNIGDNVFYYSKNLKHVDLGDNVRSIGDWAFNGTAIENLVIPVSIERIGCGALRIDTLKSVTLPFVGETRNGFENTNIGYAFGYVLTDDRTFQKSYAAEIILIGDQDIRDNSFKYCSGLKSIVIGDEINSIGSGAFAGCADLESISFGKGVETIGDLAFASCASLKSVTLGENVTILGESAFNNCTSLERVVLNNKLTQIKNTTFYLCGKLVSINIPDSVLSIGDRAFSYCNSLINLTMGNGVLTIGEEAFAYCKGLVSFTISDSVLTVGKNAFRDCWELTSLNVGKGLTKISESAFVGCTISRVNITDVSAWAQILFEDSGATPVRDTTTVYLNGSPLTDLVLDNVALINDFAFYNFKFNTVTIGTSVKKINSYALNITTISSDDKIRYLGTSDQWKAIEKAESSVGKWIVCTDAEIWWNW